MDLYKQAKKVEGCGCLKERLKACSVLRRRGGMHKIQKCARNGVVRIRYPFEISFGIQKFLRVEARRESQGGRVKGDEQKAYQVYPRTSNG